MKLVRDPEDLRAIPNVVSEQREIEEALVLADPLRAKLEMLSTSVSIKLNY